MAKAKVTLTLEAANLHELRALVGARSLSASIDDAIGAYVQHRRQLGAIDVWLDEMERQHGPVPVESLNGPRGSSTDGTPCERVDDAPGRAR